MASIDNPLGEFLKDRRAKLDPARLGYPVSRRRTPGLRWEEVAQRSNVSTTWYTWLEQGRGGAPSADVLDRLARGLALNEVEREHLFLLAQNRLPEVNAKETVAVSPHLQRVLDALESTPAFIRTAEWDVVAYNRAAFALWPDQTLDANGQFNILERFFSQSDFKALGPQWRAAVRPMVASFRAETARAGFSSRAHELVGRLTRQCPDFQEIWQDHDVGTIGEGIKTFENTARGPITLEYSTFAVDGGQRLRLVVFNPATNDDRDRVKALIAMMNSTALASS